MYYLPEDEKQWSLYWNIRSDTICTISARLYKKLIEYIFNKYALESKTYALFSIIDKPYLTVEFGKEKIVSKNYAGDNTCDKLYVHCLVGFITSME